MTNTETEIAPLGNSGKADLGPNITPSTGWYSHEKKGEKQISSLAWV